MPETTQLLEDWSVSSESSKPITPFAIADEVLVNCGARWNAGQDFLREQDKINVLESNPLALGEPFAPEVELPVDLKQLSSITGIPTEKINLSVCIRDRALWQFTNAAAWQVGSHPLTFKFDPALVLGLAGHRGFELSISLFCDDETTDKNGNKLPEGALVANKTFHLDVKNDDAGGGFPIQPCDPEDFGDERIDKNAAWFIRWHNMENLTEPNMGASEILTVLINKKCSDRLYHLRASDEVGSILWMEMASDILLEIALVILSYEELPEPADSARGFVPRTVRALMKQTKLGFDELRNLVSTQPQDASSILRSHLQAHMGLSKAIGRSHIGNQLF